MTAWEVHSTGITKRKPIRKWHTHAVPGVKITALTFSSRNMDALILVGAADGSVTAIEPVVSCLTMHSTRCFRKTERRRETKNSTLRHESRRGKVCRSPCPLTSPLGSPTVLEHPVADLLSAA